MFEGKLALALFCARFADGAEQQRDFRLVEVVLPRNLRY